MEDLTERQQSILEFIEREQINISGYNRCKSRYIVPYLSYFNYIFSITFKITK